MIDGTYPIHRDNALVLEDLPLGRISRVHVELVGDGLGSDILVPVLVARGRRPGPVLGLTAAVHGNELNGIRVIHDLFEHLDVEHLRGTLVGVVVVNVPGLHWHQRYFSDGRDLNHRFPGSEDGNVSDVYAYRILHRVVAHFDFLVDLHTASFGRENSLYVRADMTHAQTARMAYLQRPQIIVHNPASDHTLRGAAMDLNIPSITVEIGDPQKFQPAFIRSCRAGLRAIMADAGLVPKRASAMVAEPVLCESSEWLYTHRGGLLEVTVATGQSVGSGERIACLRNAFGDERHTYLAPHDGIVIGRSVNPVGQTGARILHLGRVAGDGHPFVRRREASSLSSPTGS